MTERLQLPYRIGGGLQLHRWRRAAARATIDPMADDALAELFDFLGRNLTADETRARQASDGPWKLTRHHAPDPWLEIVDQRGQLVAGIPGDPGVERGQAAADAAYLVTHDPRADLARIRAHRLILRTLRAPATGSLEAGAIVRGIKADLLLAMAQQYDTRPGWREEWHRDYGP
ncbi:DUF6221 family protein [Saccharothrix sp. AJ9571]|nr:DUF6221 family protein [Saccharothrix sp. AJ9571]